MTVAEQLSDLPYADVLVPHSGPLDPGGEYDAAWFDSESFEDRDVGNVKFLECAFTSVTFSGGQLRRARFNDVWVRGGRIVGTDLVESVWLDSTLLSSALSGVEAYGAQLRRVTFARCKLDSVNLRAAVLHDVTFEDCALADVDLAEATLTAVRFPGTELRGLRLHHVTLKQVDFRGATTLDIADGYDSLRNAVISSGQLIEIGPGLAAAQGIVVED